MTLLLRLLEKEKAALVEEKEQLMRASQELLGQVDNQLPFDPNDPKVKELEEWECSVSRSVIVEVGLDISLIYGPVTPVSNLFSLFCVLGKHRNRGCGPALQAFSVIYQINFRIIPATDSQNCSN